MARVPTSRRWTPPLSERTGPRYLAIADALESDVRTGRLTAGDALPTQRELARRLGVNFTTVTRAYAEARRRGLLTARVGRGTFVANPDLHDAIDAERSPHDHELSVNAPPVPAWLDAAFRGTVARLAADPAVARKVLTYASRLGDAKSHDAGVAWLESRGLHAEIDRVVVTGGAQHALTLLLSTIAKPGDVVLTEKLAYPGLHTAAAMARVRLAPVEIDEEGLRPDDLEAMCQRARPKALFCVPTLQNPTAAIMSYERRHDIITVARRHHVPIVEDDICGPLFPDATPLAAIAPNDVVHIASLSKCVAPGLRTAFVLVPTSAEAERLAAAVRTSVLMLSPLALALAATWIGDGTAQKAVADIRREATLRVQLARRLLAEDRVVAPPGSLHAWLRLPESSTLAGFVAQAQQRGVRVAPADWYVTHSEGGVQVPSAVRLTLGAEPDRARLERALRALASIIDQPQSRRASSL